MAGRLPQKDIFNSDASKKVDQGWLRCLSPRPMARHRLICFPWAGGGPSGYRDWSKALPAEIEVWGVCLPAHEGRIAEPPATDLCEAAATITRAIESFVLPVTLFGHSLGAWLAFEVARRMAASGGSVQHLVVSGRRAPSVQDDDYERIGELPDAVLLDRIRTLYGGIPEEVWSQPEILESMLPALRGDLRMLESYRYAPASKLTCPILVMGGEADTHTNPVGWLEAWCAETEGRCQVLTLPGGHFFLQSARAAVLQNIRELHSAA